MDIGKNMRFLRMTSRAVTIFALVAALAGTVQIGFGAIAVSEEYERIERFEEETRPRTYYGYERQWAAAQAEYNRSSSSFFLEGRFLPSDDTLAPDGPAVLSLFTLLLAGLGFTVASLLWVWRAHANLREVGIATKWAPEMAAASFVIPVVNFVVPFETMRELFNRSHDEGDDFAHSTAEDVTAWWTALLTGLVIISAMIVKMIYDAGTNLIIMTPLWMEYAILCFAFILILAAGFLFSGLTRKITAAQADLLPQIDPAEMIDEPAPRLSVNIVGS